MSFKGDLSTIGLSEVFQMISMAGKEGTLVVQDAESRKCIHFGTNGVQLLSTGKRKGLKIGELLVRAGKITDFRLREVLDNQKITKKLLGEALIESGYVTEQDIQDVVRGQIEEEIYDLFLWKKASFEFVEGPPAAEFQDADHRATKLSFDVNSLLLEAVRRVDEWNIINSKIPSMDCIFAFVSQVAREEEEQSAKPQMQRVFSHIDGQSTLAEVVEQGGVTRFEACKALVELLDRGKVRMLTVGEVVDLGKQRLQDGRRDKGLKLLQAAVSMEPHDPEIAIQYARFLESEGQGKQAAEAYVRVGRILSENGRGGDAQEYFRRATELNPEDAGAKQAMLKESLKAGDSNTAVRVAEDLIAKAIARQEYSHARELCEDLLRADPNNVDGRIQFCRVLQLTGHRKELDEQIKHIRKNLPPDPGDAARIVSKLKELVPPTEGGGRTPSRISRGRGKKVAIVVIALVVLGAAGVAAKFEMDARSEFEKAATAADLRRERKDFAGALQVLQEFRRTRHFNSPFVRPKVEEKERQIRAASEFESKTRATSIDVLRQKLLEDIDDALTRAGRSFDDGSYKIAQDTVESLIATIRRKKDEEFVKSSPEYMEKVDRKLADARVLEEKVVVKIDSIRGLKRDADGKVKDGDFKAAVQIYIRLIEDYPRYVYKEDIKFPLRIRVRPDGAKVFDKRRGELGTIKNGELVVQLDYKELPLQLRLTKRGYRDREGVSADYDDGETPEISLDEKLGLSQAWPWLPFEKEVEWAPVFSNGAVYVANGQSLYGITAETATKVEHLTRGKPVSGAPVLRGGKIFFGAGALHVFDPALKKESTVPLGSEMVGSPGVSDDGRYVAAGTVDRILTYIDLQSIKEFEWQRQLPSPVIGEPVVREGVVYAVCADGMIRAVAKDRELWNWGGTVSTSPVLAGDRLYVGLREGKVVGLDLAGAVVWEKDTRGAPATPTVTESTVYVATATGMLHAFGLTGGKSWAWQSVKPIRGRPVVAMTRVIVAAEDRLWAIDASTGQHVWYFRPREGAKFSATPLVAGKIVYAGASDKALYAVELD